MRGLPFWLPRILWEVDIIRKYLLGFVSFFHYNSSIPKTNILFMSIPLGMRLLIQIFQQRKYNATSDMQGHSNPRSVCDSNLHHHCPSIRNSSALFSEEVASRNKSVWKREYG